MRKIVKLENLIYTTLFLLPIYLVRVSFFGVPLNLLDILELAVILWWLWDKKYPKPIWKSIVSGKNSYFWPVVLMFVGLVLSASINKTWVVSLGLLKSWFVLPLVFVIVVSRVLDEKQKKIAFGAFIFSAVTVASIALGYKLIGLVTYDGRLAGIFNSPNYLAMYVALGIIVLSALWSQNLKRYALPLSILGVCLYFTFSYASWAVLVLVLCGLFLLEKKKFSKNIIFLGVALFLFLFLQLSSTKFNALWHLQARSSLASRVMIWQAAGKIVEDNWVWGIGLGNFQNKYLAYQKFFPPYLEWAVPHPHNLYLAWWLQAGLVGLIGFGWLIYVWVHDFLRSPKSPLVFASLGIMAYALLHGLVDTTYFKNDLAVLFWLAFLPIWSRKKEPRLSEASLQDKE